MNNTIDEVHECLLNMAKDFHKICIENDLKYYLIGGTFLGAIRHSGFIPWDDDMDIGMPRESYDKFIKLPDSKLPSYLTRLKKGYGKESGDFLFLKLCDNRTTLIENINEKRIEGIYIDIFPIDGAHKTKIGSIIKYFYSRVFVYLLWLNASERKRNNILKRIITFTSKKMNNRKIYIKGNEMLSNTKINSSKYIGNFMGNWGYNEIMKKEYYGEPKLYKFEDTFFYGPEKPHEFLSSVYGDYMELPPIEKQKTHHTYEYINLSVGFERFNKRNKF